MGNCHASPRADPAVDTPVLKARKAPMPQTGSNGSFPEGSAAPQKDVSPVSGRPHVPENTSYPMHVARGARSSSSSFARTVPVDLRDVSGLNFLSPQLLRAHGLMGAISVAIGLYATFRTMLGYNDTPRAPSGAVAVYAVCGIVGCLGALGLINKAPSSVRIFFQMGALLQIGMLYFTYRFDSFPTAMVPGAVMRGLDVVMAGVMASTLLVLVKNTIQDPKKVYRSRALKIATCCGIAAIGSLCGYPIQLALMGAAWLEQVFAWYPLQQVAFPYYVYIPATLGFNVIFFSATLHLRNLVSTSTFVKIILGFVFGTLVPTVVLQEVYIPRVSTQKLLIFQPPASTSWGACSVFDVC